MKTSRIIALLLLAVGLLVAGPTPSYADGSTTHAATAASADSDPTVLSWRGPASKAQLPLGPSVLPGAPKSFKAYARTQLRETWQTYLHGRPACKRAPVMDVRHLRTDGFAFGYVGTYPQPGCQTGGGYEAFWAVRQGEWKQVIGTQDVPTCARLEKLDFPSSVARTECSEGTKTIQYQHD